MTRSDTPKTGPPAEPKNSEEDERGSEAPAWTVETVRWRGLVFVGTCLAAIAGGALVLHAVGRRSAPSTAPGLSPPTVDASRGSLRLPPDVLREYQAQIAALASERARASEEERRAHADRLELTALETARQESERRLQRLEEGRITATAGVAEVHTTAPVTDTVASIPTSDPALVETGAPAAGEVYRIGLVSCPARDLRALIAAVAPICACSPAGTPRWDLVGFLIARAGVIARTVAGIQRPQAALIEALHAEIALGDSLPRPFAWSDQIHGGQGDDRQIVIPATAEDAVRALVHGVLLARAQAEGGWSRERLDERATSALAAIPSTICAGIDMTHVQAVSARVLAGLWWAPVVPHRVAEAFDTEVVGTLANILPGRPAAERHHVQECVAVQATAALLALAHRSTAGVAEPMDASAMTVREVIRRSMAQAIAVEHSTRVIRDVMVPDYATLFGESRRSWSADGSHAGEAAAAAVEAAEDLHANSSDTESAHDDDLIAALTSCATAAAETVLAQSACRDLVDEGLGRLLTTCSRSRIEAARTCANTRIRIAVTMPMTRGELVRLAVSIAHDASAMARGMRRIPPITGASVQVAARDPDHRAPGSGAAALVRGVEDGSGVVVHGQSDGRLVRPVVIPAGSYADARVLVGVVCELGVATTEDMLVALDGTWEVPSGGRVHMRDLRVVVECSAYNGNRRVHARIVRLALCPPGHAQITVPAVGWLSDNVIGAGGVLAQGWDWNPDVVIPLAGAQGILSALAGALKPTQQVTSVNVSTTVVDQEHQPAASKAAGTAAQSLSDGASQQLDRILAQLRPALVVPNNQEVTVILAEDAVLPIPLEEWATAVEPVPRAAGAESDGFDRGRGFSH